MKVSNFSLKVIPCQLEGYSQKRSIRIGIDLAKNCVSAALLTTDGEVVGIDRLDYSELEKSAQALSPTTFAMEPCTEMNYLGKFCKIRNYSHSPIGDLIFEESGRNFPSGRN